MNNGERNPLYWMGKIIKTLEAEMETIPTPQADGPGMGLYDEDEKYYRDLKHAKNEGRRDEMRHALNTVRSGYNQYASELVLDGITSKIARKYSEEFSCDKEDLHRHIYEKVKFEYKWYQAHLVEKRSIVRATRKKAEIAAAEIIYKQTGAAP